tara:strand:- start:859 stop:1506 length:648 start_codon:yes stop_codon:yes gene_type:complete
MSNLIKRFVTSILLICIILIAFNNIYILFLLTIFIFFQAYYENYLILNKIILKKNKLILYLLLLLSLFYICLFTFIILKVFLINSVEQKIIFYFIITICVSTDIGGYVFGKILKGKKLTKISPNKTYSGLYGSYILSTSLCVFFYDKFFSYQIIILTCILISTISQLGDLFFSYLKRKAKIKDTSTILPGHGGVLDRIDGMIFAIPFGMLLITTL